MVKCVKREDDEERGPTEARQQRGTHLLGAEVVVIEVELRCAGDRNQVAGVDTEMIDAVLDEILQHACFVVVGFRESFGFSVVCVRNHGHL